ncbi:MAG: hypothetical protein HY598_02245 [Candidatus Omnitrophica bacterium]|nr:hypothetical protein [Candidatus Omnitrophota bacterium]
MTALALVFQEIQEVAAVTCALRLPSHPVTFATAVAIRLFYLELFLVATVGLLG